MFGLWARERCEGGRREDPWDLILWSLLVGMCIWEGCRSMEKRGIGQGPISLL